MKYIYRKVQPVYETVRVPKWWYFGSVTEKQVVVGYDRNRYDNSDDNFEFTEDAYQKLENYFKTNPPRVGDVIYIECPYMIVKKFYNLNKDTMEIWIAPQIGWAERTAPHVP